MACGLASALAVAAFVLVGRAAAPPHPRPEPRVSARVAAVVPLGTGDPAVTRVRVKVTFTGLKGRAGSLRWHLYNDVTELPMSEESTLGSPVLAWRTTDWKPTLTVPTPPVPWQLRVTAYGPDGRKLASGHSDFAFR
ncbi:hypothetical protein BLA24_22160 [Streptomyces cinnamoneus]|uniref:Uncharacterized protein n=1 Tax=Streptomyces cinnamoneus TaxID=53446 RepID=A0A2G1XGD2_STRCJ|nr:hypothetical protein BLA24_22160 [Streptomyces cinnamoneus]PPT12953.1 hypothetical protein CYQ11_08625 [Streptomyces cinnamoneus]